MGSRRVGFEMGEVAQLLALAVRRQSYLLHLSFCVILITVVLSRFLFSFLFLLPSLRSQCVITVLFSALFCSVSLSLHSTFHLTSLIPPHVSLISVSAFHHTVSSTTYSRVKTDCCIHTRNINVYGFRDSHMAGWFSGALGVVPSD